MKIYFDARQHTSKTINELEFFFSKRIKRFEFENINTFDLSQTLIAPGILLTSVDLKDRDPFDLSFSGNNIYVDFCENDGRKFVISNDGIKVSSIDILGNDHADGLTPVGIYSFEQDDTLENILKAHSFNISPLPRKNPVLEKTPCLFLDRDGVINVDTGYLHHIEDLIIRPGIEKVIRSFNEKNWPVICVTNQSGVARGMFSLEDVVTLHGEINKRLEAMDAHIDHFEIGPYYFEKGVGPYKKHSVLRKPHSGMIYKASPLFNIDFSNSIMVGDKNSDKFHNFKFITFLLQGEYELSSKYGEIVQSFEELLKKIKN